MGTETNVPRKTQSIAIPDTKELVFFGMVNWMFDFRTMKFHVKDNDFLGVHLIGVVEIPVETINSGKRKRARYILILNHPNLFASIELF